MANKRKLISM